MLLDDVCPRHDYSDLDRPTSRHIVCQRIVEQARIEMETDFFLRRGGKPDVIETVMPRHIKEPREDHYNNGRANAHAKSVKEKPLKYIRTYARKSPQVIVNGVYVGSYPDVPTEKVARDQYLKDNSLPPAGG